MQARLLAVLGLAILIQGCAQNAAPLAPAVEPADEAGHAAKCDVTPNPLPIAGAAPATAQMTVGNDGGWCAVRLAQVKSAVLRTPPAHGKPYFRNVRDITRLQYTPAPGYTGPDSFVFQLVPGGTLVRTNVTVTAP